ncbi:MAG: hypothetical protein ACXVXJ_04620 [Mycobacteriaceae bacterium]
MTGTMTRKPKIVQQQPLLFPVVVGFIALACGIAIGVAWQNNEHRGQWQTGRGYIGIHEVSVRSQGWTYGVDDAAVVPWIDSDGTWHEGGWPACLRRFQTQPVTFQARSVTIDGRTWRPIVAIDCRQ